MNDDDLMGEEQPGPGHNSGAHRVAADQLRQLIERVETLEQEKQEVADQIKGVYSESKGRGYDTKVMRKLVAERKRDPDHISEEEAVLQMYRRALGMEA